MSTFNELITFTRSTTGTYLGSDGLLKTGAINEPRLEYDIQGNALGLLVEEARANAALQSEDMTAANKTGLTVTSNSRKAPDGVGFADLCKLSAVAEEHFVQRGGSAVIGTKYAVSCFVRKAQGTVYFGFGGLGIGGNPPLFNLVTGAIHTTGSSSWGKVEIESYSEEFYRCSAVGIAAGTTATKFLVTNDPSNLSAAGDGSDGAYIWGTQVEENKNFCTSYIPTTVSTVTRGADVANTGLSNYYYRQKIGTLAVEFKPKYDETSSLFIRVAELGTLTGTSSRIPFLVDTLATRLRMQVYESSSQVFNQVFTASLANDTVYVKAAFAYKPLSGRIAFEGSLAGSEDDNIPLVSTRDTIGIMQRSNSGGTLTGHIKRLRYIPQRLSDTDMAALT